MSYQTETIDNTADYIDSRDIAHRISYLEFLDDPDTYETPADYDLWSDEIEELAKLRELEKEINLYSGETLIRESAFKDYARDSVEGIYGDNPLYSYVDWEQFANDYQMDFTSVEFDGVTYWYRS